jgi:hypothetical protein
MQYFLPSKELENLTEPFSKLRESLMIYGHKEPKFFFTDNVSAEKGFLQDALPSLNLNVKHVLPVGTSQFPLLQVPENVKIRVINDFNEANHTLSFLLSDILPHKTSQWIAIGFDAEWDYNPITRVSHPL